MRAVLQRVGQAAVKVDGETIAEIGPGWVVLLGIGPGDDRTIADHLVDKIANLRVFEDPQGKMNLSATDVEAEFLLVSQFTLYADVARGRRPSFTGAAAPELAAPIVEYVASALRQRGFRVQTGRFGALMDVELVNHGPVTIVLSSDDWGRSF